MKTSLIQLASWLSKASITGNAEIDDVTTDSRNVVVGNLFVALRGERFDAHDFLLDVIAKGAAAVLAERLPAYRHPVPLRREQGILAPAVTHSLAAPLGKGRPARHCRPEQLDHGRSENLVTTEDQAAPKAGSHILTPASVPCALNRAKHRCF